MNSQNRDPVGIMLLDEEIELLRQWSAEWTYAEIGRHFGVDPKTVSRWHKRSHGITRHLHRTVVQALRRKQWQTAAEKLVSPDIPLSDSRTDAGLEPLETLRIAFEEGRELHYGRFAPDEAIYRLTPLAFDPTLALLPLDEALNILAATMSILRQSLHASEGNFLVQGRACLMLLGHFSRGKRDQRLEAMICIVAWELIAVTAQRGWAADSMPWLERVNSIIKRRGLKACLTSGREHSMARLTHWARVIAPRDFAAVRRCVNRDGGSIVGYAIALVDAPPAETHNIIVQRMAELMRFSMQDDDSRYLQKTADYFDATLRPIIRDLGRSSDNFFTAGHDERAIPAHFTPSTAMALVYLNFVVPLHLERRGLSDSLEESRVLAGRIHGVSDGAIMLQRFNDPLQDMLKLKRAMNVLHRDSLNHFACVSDISGTACRKLHAMAGQLLDLVDGASSPAH
jgi:hypothetical protein